MCYSFLPLFSRSSLFQSEPLLHRTTKYLSHSERNRSGNWSPRVIQKPHFSSISKLSAINSLLYLLPGNKIGWFMNLDKFLGLSSPNVLSYQVERLRWAQRPLPELQKHIHSWTLTFPVSPEIRVLVEKPWNLIGKGWTAKAPIHFMEPEIQNLHIFRLS